LRRQIGQSARHAPHSQNLWKDLNMTEIISASERMLTIVEQNTKSLLPLLSLLKAPEGPDRIAQLMNLLELILAAQRQQAEALKEVGERLDRLSRR